MTTLTVSRLHVHFSHLSVLHDLNFKLNAGQLIGLIGPNGAGKTTLLRAIAQLIDHEGKVLLDTINLSRLKRIVLARKLAYLAQGHHIHWPLPAAEVVALGRLPHRISFSAQLSAVDRHAIESAMQLTDCLQFAKRRIDNLSDGEKARVMLARALAVNAPVLLCDEPIASLDPYHQLNILAMLRLHAESGAIVICVLHDLTCAVRFCHRLLLLDNGKLIADGEAAQVLTPNNLANIYRVHAINGRFGEENYLLPWACIGSNDY